jgi:uncharacterized membrane-anchored protein YhcB (DUF1043 family)
MNMLAEVVGIGPVVLVIAGVVVGAVFSYLFLRANPDKKAELDEEVEKISDELKGK